MGITNIFIKILASFYMQTARKIIKN